MKLKIHKLLRLVYGDWHFYCDSNDYFQASNLYINRVLTTHSGMPVSIGAIVLYLAASLNLPIYPINFPAQLILRAEVGHEVAFIDPWDGEYIPWRKLQQLHAGVFGLGTEFRIEALQRTEEDELRHRFQQLAKNALIREKRNEGALKYIESLLRRHPDDPYEIRDRGLVLAQMGCYRAAADDLQYFIDRCPHDPGAFSLAAQVAELRREFYSIH